MRHRRYSVRRRAKLTGWWLAAAAVVALVAWWASDRTGVIPFKTFDVEEFVQLMAGLVLVALFIERAVEVFISGWRQPEAKDLERRIKAIAERQKVLEGAAGGTIDVSATSAVDRRLVAPQKGPEDRALEELADGRHEEAQAKPASADERWALLEEERLALAERLGDWTGTTRRWAYAAAVVLGLAAAALGIRALGLFVDGSALSDLREAQQRAFATFDVVLTAAVLAGGADALHQVVETFVGFMEQTKKRTKGEGEGANA